MSCCIIDFLTFLSRTQVIIFKMMLFQIFNYLSWISYCHRVVWNIINYHTSCANNTTVAYRHSWTNDDTCAQPTIVANSDTTTFFDSFSPFNIVDRVVGCDQLAIRAYFCMSTYAYESSIKHGCSIIYKNILTKLDAVTVIAMKWRNDC